MTKVDGNGAGTSADYQWGPGDVLPQRQLYDEQCSEDDIYSLRTRVHHSEILDLQKMESRIDAAFTIVNCNKLRIE